MLNKRLDDKTSREILLDPVDFKMSIAKNYLNKIPECVPLDFDWNHFILEANCESFLFFANLAIENLAIKISEHFNLIPKSKYNTRRLVPNLQTTGWKVNDNFLNEQFAENTTIFSVRDSLDLTNSNHKLIYDIIMKYFDRPRQTASDWDFSNSSLWQLRELRNHIAHSTLLNRMALRGTIESKTLYLFRFTLEKYRNENRQRNQPEIIGQKIAITTDSPKQYFTDLFKNLTKFVDEIRNAVSYNGISYQYRNTLDFELKP